ncbi:TetR/AcrR family transcriptional regulator [Streptomyces sp. LP05-1]|uniref:TetR/AcrR family transcriptional regulator n=1 Tax=Streptomyces pyxinae TaxID=2970734 RepID=A0ABT2CCG4_9ACTN|nr:TetR/AcrR family transcriptional regulator [Streptomyces sp. LP05-1]MCS0635107.1 TetR/AcrR family transcriptional regulator [Streptomyces sp. LP05-1]
MPPPADRTKRPPRTSVWLDADGARGRRAEGGRRAEPAERERGALDRDRITATSVRLLDDEGLAKFSMRRLAAELDVTAMSVYWYVDTKDDLLELAIDAVFGELELPAPDAPGGDWRDDLRALAVAYRSLLVRHPWVSPLMGDFLNIGPHAMAFARCVHRIVAHTGVPPHGQTGAMSAVFQFVYGFGTIEGHFKRRCESAGMTQDEYYQQAMATIGGRPELARTFAEATEMMVARGGDTVEEMRERDFDFALRLLVAGIEAMRDDPAGRRPRN